MQEFANRLQTNDLFRATVTNGLRTVLVDEFQDVNDDIYTIIRQLSLSTVHPVSVMAIGDDDQDILAWNRDNAQSSDCYFRQFIIDYALQEQDILSLNVNFRSGEAIVAHSQVFINDFFSGHFEQSPRLKTSTLHAARGAQNAVITQVLLNERQYAGAFDNYLNEVHYQLLTRLPNDTCTIAILCRTNTEVARAYHVLRQACSDLVIQNNAKLPVSRTRHIALWLELLKQELAQHGDRPLSESIFKMIDGTYQQLDIPEVRKAREKDIQPRKLWDLCEREFSYPYLSHLIEFVESIDSDDLVRLQKQDKKGSCPPVISTIHKVKGLEFDEVIVLPSFSSFPFSRNINQAQLLAHASEELRLQYVAMTRAKSKLQYIFGKREYSWYSHVAFYPGEVGGSKILGGTLEEVGISWAWTTHPQYNPDAEQTLSYIEEHVRIGDQLKINGSSILHDKQAIGRLARQCGAGNNNSNLTVSAVLRHPYDGITYYEGDIAQSVEQQGWGLVVLVSGVLRA